MVLLSALVATAFFASVAAASAATYFVEEGGTGADPCIEADPCGSIQEAIQAHRDNSPAPGDVIEVAAGDYAQDFEAAEAADDGLTIRGELDPGGVPDTIVSGDGAGVGAPDCANCIVVVGFSPTTNVTLANIAVTQDDADDDVTPIHLDGGSDLDTVDVFVDDEFTFAAVEFCSDPGTEIVDTFIDATLTFARGIDGCAEVDITDSQVFTETSAALDVAGTPGETTEITRSWLTSALDSSAPETAFVDGDLTVDSSIISGGSTALFYPGNDVDVLINNSTIDAGDFWLDDGESVFVGRNGESETTIDSSILVDEIAVETSGADGAITCEYTNFDALPLPDPPYTNDCPPAGAPGSTNTNEDPNDLFAFPSGPNDTFWGLATGSAAIDAGQPGEIPAGTSTTDFDGDPRRVPGTTATCPDGIRDQGAYEATAVSCQPPTRNLSVSTTGTGTGTVTGAGINCGGGATDCSETVALGASVELTATPAEGSSFDGFAGGGCSTSPCNVTLDSSKSVEARFTNTRAGQRTLTVETSGNGSGTITGPGIDCGGGNTHTDCSQSYPFGETVELRTNANKNSIFNGFTGAGCEADPCTVTMDASRSVVGRFIRDRTPFTTFAHKTNRTSGRAVFRMRSSQPVPTYECRLDDGKWKDCNRRVVLRGLERGRHVFRARSTNKLGVTGPPARANFRVTRR